MKTSLNVRHFFNFFQLNQSLQCSKNYLSLASWLSRARQSLAVKTKLLYSGVKAALQTYRVGRAVSQILLLASVASKEFWSNPRVKVGVLISCVALPFWKCHTFFDINDRIDGFYYVNYAFYFNTIRAYACGLFVSIGAFIAIPRKVGFGWFAVPIAFFCVTEICLESGYTNYTDFYKPMPDWQALLIIALSVPACFATANYMVFRKYHLKDGNLARINGIINTPGIPADKKMEILKGLIIERQNYNARV